MCALFFLTKYMFGVCFFSFYLYIEQLNFYSFARLLEELITHIELLMKKCRDVNEPPQAMLHRTVPKPERWWQY